jgi:hypothetical protein
MHPQRAQPRCEHPPPRNVALTHIMHAYHVEHTHVMQTHVMHAPRDARYVLPLN